MKLGYSIRKAQESDKSYLMSTTLKALKHIGFNKYMRKTYYYQWHNRLIDELYNESTIYVCVDKESGLYIQSFIMIRTDSNAVVFAHTRKPLRRMGLFKSLFKHHFGEWKQQHDCVMISKDYVSIFGKKCEYKPYGDM